MGQTRSVAATLAFCAVLLAPAEAFNLTIVHWNDVHARNTPASESTQQLCLEEPYIDPSCYGGHARIATICKEAKATNPATLCIDAGDEFSGTTWDVLFQGAQTAPVLEAAGTDVMGLGNHEFDFGVASLAAFIGNVTFPVLGACNMDITLEPSLDVKKWHVATLNETKVALLGVIVDTTANVSSAGAVTFSDPVAAVPACMQEFMASPDSVGVNIIGLVSHVGVSTDREIAQAAPGLDFIVSAHSHTPMFPGLLGECLNFTAGTCGAQDDSPGEYPEIASGVPILQQFFASKYVGVATLAFDDLGNLTAASGKSVPLGTYYDAAGNPTTVAEDAEVAALLQGGYTEVVGRSLDVVGNLPGPLSAARPDIRIQEMPLANVICSAMIAALNDTAYTQQAGIQQAGIPLVCVMNGGGIRADLPAGDVTFGDVASVLPFGNVVEVLEITGAQLKQVLEFGFDAVEDVSSPPGKYPHLGGGLSAIINSALPAGQRIVALQYNCGNVTDTDSLHLVTNDFLGRGGDGYAMLDGLPKVLGDVLGPPLDTALADYLTANTPAGGSVSQSLLAVDGRFYDLSNPGIPLCPIDGSGALAPTAAIPASNGTTAAGAANATAISPSAAAPAAAEPANSTDLPEVAPIDGATTARGATVETDTAGCGVPYASRDLLKTLFLGVGVTFVVAGFR